MQYLITGGAGFIGGHLVRALLAAGARVRVFDNLSSGSRAAFGPAAADVELHVGDLRDAAALRTAATGVDAIVHLAALVSVAESVEQPATTYETNVLGTLNLLDAARAAGVARVVQASTCAVYGASEKLPASERDMPVPLSPYAAAKLAAEQAGQLYHRLYGRDVVALRFFNVYGPRQDPASPYAAVVPRFAAALRAGQQPTIYGDGGQTRDFVFVGDIVAGLQCAATAPDIGGAVFNVGRGEEHSVRDLAYAVGAALGVAVDPIYAPARAGEVRRSRADVQQFAARAGFRATTDLATGLAATLAT